MEPVEVSKNCRQDCNSYYGVW